MGKYNYSALAEAINTGTIAATVTSVARSGASRKVKFFGINERRQIYGLTYDIAQLLNLKLNADHTATIHGGGMDVIYATLENAARKLTAQGYECEYKTYQLV